MLKCTSLGSFADKGLAQSLHFKRFLLISPLMLIGIKDIAETFQVFCFTIVSWSTEFDCRAAFAKLVWSFYKVWSRTSSIDPDLNIADPSGVVTFPQSTGEKELKLHGSFSDMSTYLYL